MLSFLFECYLTLTHIQSPFDFPTSVGNAINYLYNVGLYLPNSLAFISVFSLKIF